MLPIPHCVNKGILNIKTKRILHAHSLLHLLFNCMECSTLPSPYRSCFKPSALKLIAVNRTASNAQKIRAKRAHRNVPRGKYLLLARNKTSETVQEGKTSIVPTARECRTGRTERNRLPVSRRVPSEEVSRVKADGTAERSAPKSSNGT